MSTEQEERRGARGGLDVGLVARAGTCAALLGAAVVHSTVVGEHYEQWPLAGLFFLALTVGEALLAVAGVLTWGRGVASLVLVSSLGTLAVWAVSRTVGLPFGPAEFRAREEVGIPDLACVVLEISAVLLVLPWTRPGRSPGRTSRPDGASFVAAGTAVLLAVTVAGWGVTPTLLSEDEHIHHHDG